MHVLDRIRFYLYCLLICCYVALILALIGLPITAYLYHKGPAWLIGRSDRVLSLRYDEVYSVAQKLYGLEKKPDIRIYRWFFDLARHNSWVTGQSFGVKEAGYFRPSANFIVVADGNRLDEEFRISLGGDDRSAQRFLMAHELAHAIGWQKFCAGAVGPCSIRDWLQDWYGSEDYANEVALHIVGYYEHPNTP